MLGKIICPCSSRTVALSIDDEVSVELSKLLAEGKKVKVRTKDKHQATICKSCLELVSAENVADTQFLCSVMEKLQKTEFVLILHTLVNDKIVKFRGGYILSDETPDVMFLGRAFYKEEPRYTYVQIVRTLAQEAGTPIYDVKIDGMFKLYKGDKELMQNESIWQIWNTLKKGEIK